MGICYAYVNDQKKEILFPNIDDGNGEAGSKRGNFLRRDHPIHVLLFLALFYKWHGDSVRLCDDCGDDAYFEYQDVTGDLVKIANKYEGLSFAYTNNKDK